MVISTFGKKVVGVKNTINNLANRGNTATTSHMVAMWDNILDGNIQAGDNIVFGITGSGQKSPQASSSSTGVSGEGSLLLGSRSVIV